MLLSLNLTVTNPSEFSSVSPPKFVFEIQPWRHVFFRNLRDLIWSAKLPPLDLTSHPAPFWDDVFVARPFPGNNLLRSYVAHALFLFAVYAFTLAGVFDRPAPLLRDPFKHSEIAYYPADNNYLPPIETPSTPARIAKTGQPKLARQEIISVPAEPDNTNQTIIAANSARLKRDVPLPNIVANSPVLAQQAIPTSARSARQIPRLTADVVAPAPEALPSSRRALMLPADVVAPAPESIASSRRAPILQASVVEPLSSMDEIKRRPGMMNMKAMTPTVSEPALPVPAQRASGTEQGDTNGNSAPKAAPAASAQGLGTLRGAGQLIALGLNPVEAHGPIEIPEGNRRGSFAAGPQGKADAPGTPDIKGGGIAKDGNGGSGANKAAIAGIVVGRPPAGATVSTIVGSNAPGASPPRGAPDDPFTREKLLAAARTPDIARQPAPGAPRKKETPEEVSVFGSKRSYALSLNMPNLTSATGSWVIRFAELKQTHDAAELSAPVATNKVDPAYPADLLRDRVEGTVVLYAIIRADGTISDIRVLNSVHEKLDANAIKALQRWKFMPGSKHGVPIDLEAVVQIPFRAKRFAY